MKVLLMMLFLPIAASGASKNFNEGDSLMIYESLDVEETILIDDVTIQTGHAREKCSHSSFDLCKSGTKKMLKELPGVKCTKTLFFGYTLMANGVNRPTIRTLAKCSLDWYLKPKDESVFFNHLKKESSVVVQSSYVKESKKLGKLLVEKTTYFKYGNSSVSYFKHISGTLKGIVAGGLYNNLSTEEDQSSIYFLLKKLEDISCRKQLKVFGSGVDLIAPIFECQIDSWKAHSFEKLRDDN